ncbi:MAG: retron system putative HNH endonuclease [Saprospiraceae bacterium]
MKYIKKLTTPQFFINDTNSLTTWSEYHSTKKRRLKKHILEEEQCHLCCYCEKEVTIDKSSSHIEHIKPKSIDLLNLTFDYNNILVSCEGNHFNEIGDNSKNTCGHIKDNNFEEDKFLNPTLLDDVQDYFSFDADTGKIGDIGKNSVKANYSIRILNLNGKNDKLAEARLTAKNALIKNFSPLPIERKKSLLKSLLNNPT